MNNLADNITGLTANEKEVVFKFIKPMPDFLEKVSFGIYGIAHPDDYDNSGNWKDKKNANTSGVYQIEKWNDEEFTLIARKNLPYFNKQEKTISKIIFSYSKDFLDINKADLMIREKYNPLIDDKVWRYGSTRLDNDITYVKVMKWDQKDSYLSKRENRVALRNIFYSSLKEEGLDVTTSFLPLTISGVNKFNYSNSSMDLGGKAFSSQPYFYYGNKLPNGKKEIGEIYENGFKLFCKKINAQSSIVEYPENLDDEKNVFDIQFLGTAIVIDDPFDDIKFMFLSKQGIQLPDESGEMLAELKKDKIDIQKINRLLWEQAIIWPIRHTSSGFWIKKDSNLDISILNTTLNPIDFQFIRWN